MKIYLIYLYVFGVYYLCKNFVNSQESDVFLNTLDFLNISSDPNQINFYLYPNSNNFSDYDELIYLSQPSIQKSRFNKSNPLIVLIHGFTQSYTTEFPVILRDAYLRANYTSKANILVMDWGKLSGKYENPTLTTYLATLPSYIMATRNVFIVGKRLHEFLIFLLKIGYISSPKKIHLIGQSLGAHIAGMSGRYYHNVTSNLIGRITGNDPAGPLFQDRPINERLDSSDAEFVDIVHTNQGLFGYLGPLGHADFFINGGGPVQFECLADVTNLFCSHDLAPQYFAKSIADTSIKGCESPLSRLCSPSRKVTFGEHCPPSARGFYFLEMSIFEEDDELFI